MAGANTIGTGAVVLTANADQLVSGLDKAQKATDKWAKDTSKSASKYADVSEKKNRAAYDRLIASGKKLAEYMPDVDYVRSYKIPDAKGKGSGSGKKGGAVGALLFGAGVGVVLAGLGLVDSALNRIANVGEKAKEYGNISLDRNLAIDRAQKGFDRITAAVDDFFFVVAEKVAPAIEKIATIVEVVVFTGAEGFKALADSIGSVALTSGDVFAGLKAVAQAAAYLFDTMRAGAGVVMIVQGVFDQFIAGVLKSLAGAVRKLEELSQRLPEGMRPDWIKGAADTIDGFANKTDDLGRKMVDVGKLWVTSWGDSADKVGAFIDGVQARFNATDRIKKGLGVALAGAFGQGSVEATSVISKWEAGNILSGQSPADAPAVKVAKEQLKEAKEHKKATWKIVGYLDRGTLVKVIK